MTSSSSEPFRLDDDLLARVDAWRESRSETPSREEAVVQLVERALRNSDSIGLSDGEKLIVLMLCSLGGASGAVEDAQLIKNAVRGGHYWALDWQYPALFGQHRSSKLEALFVGRALEMWGAMEDSFARLPVEDKAKVVREAKLEGAVAFPGWDAASEEIFMQIARFMTNDLKLYSSLKRRADGRSPIPTADGYSRMLTMFTPIRQAKGRNLDAVDLIELLNARGGED